VAHLRYASELGRSDVTAAPGKAGGIESR